MANEKILIVEDEELVAQDIKVILEDLGYEVPAITPSAEEALEKIEESCPDSVLMDIMLEGEMDGIEAAQKISERYDIPVVYLTAYSNQEILQRAKKTEPYGYILKPFQERDLQINIEMALYKHEAKKTQLQLLQQRAVNKYLKKALDEKEALLREVHHRVKNNLQIIISLLSLQSKYFEDDQRIHEFFKDYVNQLKSMASIHEKVYQSEDLSSIDFTNYIIGLVSQLSSSYKKSSDIEIEIDAEDIALNVETAIPCGLIINEILTNSFKHAFPSKKGKILVEMYSNEYGMYKLKISDDGVGIPEYIEYPYKGSFGFRMLNTLITQLGGTLDLNKNNGTSFIIEFEELRYKERLIVDNSELDN
ncbi:histidine kinase dimerization/phosphoacceptor domain -containing protein [Methanobacterium alcaliphilum]|uniref:histidine kinase dimerization/phosphoacceptor domain -containing protein n=1 Tax=Methanobacterium alcaliphilum TaxID=392018 RepID=UPI00200B9EBA|nr:histidine kinase dimerization/phosphoacceptor domain -containing protein [Methanobacterium alcaliphilum]MCK9150957.1 response regulator [Methanobacterium alcaliphilum]